MSQVKTKQADDVSWNRPPPKMETETLSDLKFFNKHPEVTWFREILRELGSFQELNHDDWDDEGAKAISQQAVIKTYYFLWRHRQMMDLPKPNLVAGYTGRIALIWARKGYELKVWSSEEGYELTIKDCSTQKVKPFTPSDFEIEAKKII